MKVVITVDDERAEVVAALTRNYLDQVIAHNVYLLRKHGARIPPLYQSGVLFRLEPWAEQVQHFAHVLEVLERGYGDCKQLCAWRAAELRAQAPPALAKKYTLKIYWRVHEDDEPESGDNDPLHAAIGTEKKRRTMRIYHVQVRHPNGAVEDPSRLLHQ